MLSFVIPAHDEESLIGDTLAVLRRSAETLAISYEIIVVDDASTDRTAQIAREQGAAVVAVDKRQIAAVRNAGAKVARGDTLIFVDADTHVSAATLSSALRALSRGAVGGGATLKLDPGSARWGRIIFSVMTPVIRIARWAPGCFVFVRRDAFEAVGGFDERYFATEEIVLSRALKKLGRMVIVTPAVVTSGRKTRLYSLSAFSRLLWRYARDGRKFVQRRENLDLWYKSGRE
jgi:glycosyltransferase involved in cell wall biosynthesis